MTSRQVKVVFAAAIAAGGIAGVLGALGAALVLRSTPVAAASSGRHSATVATEWQDSGDVGPGGDAFVFHAQLEAHAREAVDPSWANEARQKYERDLGQLALKSGFSFRNVDCRTTTCVTELAFANYGAAKSNLRRLVESPWTLNCARGAQLDAPLDESSPYSTSIYFDCASARALAQAPHSPH